MPPSTYRQHHCSGERFAGVTKRRRRGEHSGRDDMSEQTRSVMVTRGTDTAGVDWASRGACRTSDPDALFVQGAEQNRAKQVCMSCVVRTECLADALDNRVEFGVWGGMTERERRALLKRRPTVTSWRRLLETARLEYERGVGLVPLDDDQVYEDYAAVS